MLMISAPAPAAAEAAADADAVVAGSNHPTVWYGNVLSVAIPPTLNG